MDGVQVSGGGPADRSAGLNRSANISVSDTGVLAFRVSAAGESAGAPDGTPARILEWRNPSGEAEIVGPERSYVGFDLAPDGSMAAAHIHEGAGGDIWTYRFAQGRLQRLTNNAGEHNASPVFSPESDRIAYASLRNGRWGLYSKRADGAGTEAPIFESETEKMPTSWSPDGLLVYSQAGDVWAVQADGASEPFPVLNQPYFESFSNVSPAGGWMAYQTNETGQSEIYVRQFPEGPTWRQVSIDGGAFPRWRADGRELYYISGPDVMAVTLDIEGDALDPGVPRRVAGLAGNPSAGQHPVYQRLAVNAEGTRFLVSRPAVGAGAAGGGIDDQLAALADGGGAAQDETRNAVILNWPQMIEAR